MARVVSFAITRFAPCVLVAIAPCLSLFAGCSSATVADEATRDAIADADGLADVRVADVGVVDAASETSVKLQVVGGGLHACAVLATGSVRCWGEGESGQLGYGNKNIIGDDETPASAGNVNVGGTVTQIAAGHAHTCALLSTGRVRCWGDNRRGQLGYGNTNTIGDDETPASAGDVNVGGTVVQIAAGNTHTCALLSTGRVRCWGYGEFGALGYGNENTIGDDETPASAGDVNVGGTVVQIETGYEHTCALLSTGRVRCWGYGGFGNYGQLGYGNTNTIGDDETPASAGDVDFGGTVTQISAGGRHTCALLATGNMRCWGDGGLGELGYGNRHSIGDDETPASAGDVNVGGTVTQIATGFGHTCALLATGNMRCWGDSNAGALGYGNAKNIGDDEAPASAGDISLGTTVVQITAGELNTCALLSTGNVRCWGYGLLGYNGTMSTSNIGDNETPASAGDVKLK